MGTDDRARILLRTAFAHRKAGLSGLAKRFIGLQQLGLLQSADRSAVLAYSEAVLTESQSLVAKCTGSPAWDPAGSLSPSPSLPLPLSLSLHRLSLICGIAIPSPKKNLRIAAKINAPPGAE